jgi:hypothetical protein
MDTPISSDCNLIQGSPFGSDFVLMPQSITSPGSVNLPFSPSLGLNSVSFTNGNSTYIPTSIILAPPLFEETKYQSPSLSSTSLTASAMTAFISPQFVNQKSPVLENSGNQSSYFLSNPELNSTLSASSIIPSNIAISETQITQKSLLMTQYLLSSYVPPENQKKLDKKDVWNYQKPYFNSYYPPPPLMPPTLCRCRECTNILEGNPRKMYCCSKCQVQKKNFF